jgi:hypothetical protein
LEAGSYTFTITDTFGDGLSRTSGGYNLQIKAMSIFIDYFYPKDSAFTFSKQETFEVVDLCPGDPNKMWPEGCGCNVSEVDSFGIAKECTKPAWTNSSCYDSIDYPTSAGVDRTLSEAAAAAALLNDPVVYILISTCGMPIEGFNREGDYISWAKQFQQLIVATSKDYSSAKMWKWTAPSNLSSPGFSMTGGNNALVPGSKVEIWNANVTWSVLDKPWFYSGPQLQTTSEDVRKVSLVLKGCIVKAGRGNIYEINMRRTAPLIRTGAFVNIVLENSTFGMADVAGDSNAGIIWAGTAAMFDLYGYIVFSNCSKEGGDGGCLYIDEDEAATRNAYNTLWMYGQVIMESGSGARNGGAMCIPSKLTLVDGSSLVVRDFHVSGTGGGIYMIRNLQLDSDASMEVSRCSAQVAGGGLALNAGYLEGNFTVQDCSCNLNNTVGKGGGIAINLMARVFPRDEIWSVRNVPKNFDVYKCVIQRCTADSGGGVYINQGRLNVYGDEEVYGEYVHEYVHIKDCTARKDGGGVYMTGAEAFMYVESQSKSELLFENNYAWGRGGSIFLDTYSSIFINSIGTAKITGGVAVVSGGNIYMGQQTWLEIGIMNEVQVSGGTVLAGHGGNIYTEAGARYILVNSKGALNLVGGKSLQGSGGNLYMNVPIVLDIPNFIWKYGPMPEGGYGYQQVPAVPGLLTIADGYAFLDGGGVWAGGRDFLEARPLWNIVGHLNFSGNSVQTGSGSAMYAGVTGSTDSPWMVLNPSSSMLFHRNKILSPPPNDLVNIRKTQYRGTLHVVVTDSSGGVISKKISTQQGSTMVFYDNSADHSAANGDLSIMADIVVVDADTAPRTTGLDINTACLSIIPALSSSALVGTDSVTASSPLDVRGFYPGLSWTKSDNMQLYQTGDNRLLVSNDSDTEQQVAEQCGTGDLSIQKSGYVITSITTSSVSQLTDISNKSTTKNQSTAVNCSTATVVVIKSEDARNFSFSTSCLSQACPFSGMVYADGGCRFECSESWWWSHKQGKCMPCSQCCSPGMYITGGCFSIGDVACSMCPEGMVCATGCGPPEFPPPETSPVPPLDSNTAIVIVVTGAVVGAITLLMCFLSWFFGLFCCKRRRRKNKIAQEQDQQNERQEKESLIPSVVRNGGQQSVIAGIRLVYAV